MAARPDAQPSAEESVERVRIQNRIIAALLQLPDPHRTTVILRFFEDLPPRKISSRMGVPVETVRSRLRVGLARMRAQLDREFSSRPAWAVPLASCLGATRTVAADLFVGSIMKAKTMAAAAALLAGIALLWSVWVVPRPELPLDAAKAQTTPLESGIPLAYVAAETPAGDLQREVVQPTRPPEAATTGNLNIRVLWGDDREPAAGLMLTVSRNDEDARFWGRQVRTEEDGMARVERLMAGHVSIQTDRNHLDYSSHGAEIRAGEDSELEIVLPVGINITGIVVDTYGAPVPGAEVYLAAPAFWRDAEHVINTGQDGRFAIRAASTLCLVSARAAGHAPSRMRFLRGSEGGTLDVRLELPGPGGEVEGIVLGPESLPVAGALVRIGEGSLKYIQVQRGAAPPLPAQVRTDEFGRFRAIGISPGQQPVSVRAAHLVPFAGSCLVAGNMTTNLEVFLNQGVVCHGTVRNSDGTPISWVEVSVGQRGEFVYYQTRSRTDGTYRLEGLPTGEIELSARHEVHGKASARLHGAWGETLRWDPQLQSGIELRGRVLTEDGAPVENSVVTVFGKGSATGLVPFIGAVTDAEGRFTVSNCPEGLLTITAEGRGIDKLRQTGVDPRAGEVVLRARRAPLPSGHIVGRVLAPDGKPVGHAEVTAYRIGGGEHQIDTTEEDKGTFELGPFRPGSYRLQVQARGYPTFRSERYELAADTTWRVGTVHLQQGGTVRLRLVRGLPGASFALHDTTGRSVSPIHPDGQVLRSEPVVPGRYQVIVRGHKVAVQTLPVTVRIGDESVVDVQLQRGIEQRFEFAMPGVIQEGLRVRVRITRDGDPVLDRRVTRSGDNPLTLTCWLAPGQYAIAVDRVGLAGSTHFTVTESDTDDVVRIELRQSGR